MWWKDDKENSYSIKKKIKLKGKRKNETNSPEIRLLLLCRVSNGTMEPDKARCFLITKHRRSMHTLSHSCIFCSKLLACVLLTSFVFHYTVNMYKASFLGSRYRLFSNFDNLPRTVTSLHYILDLIYIYMYVGTNTYIYMVIRIEERILRIDWLKVTERRLSNHGSYVVPLLQT